MTKVGKSPSVPKAQCEIYEKLAVLTDAFCAEHLNKHYAHLARQALAALSRKRPNPLNSGKSNTWACGVLYALGQHNFLFDKDSKPYLKAAELCGHFNIAPSTGQNKSKQIRDALNIRKFDFKWALPEVIERSGGMFWMIGYNGFMVDARQMPRNVQEEAYERGMIPYIYADKDKTPEQIAARKQVLSDYDRYREINKSHQSRLAAKFWHTSVSEIAQRIGLVAHADELQGIELEHIVEALDLALYQLGEDGVSAAAHDLEQWPEPLSTDERRVFAAMSHSLFSIFEVIGLHDVTGLMLRDLFSGEDVWVVDRGLEANVPAGFRLALRLIGPDKFWMTTGGSLIVNDDMWQATIEKFKPEAGAPPHPDQLAEYLFQTANKIVP